MNYEPGIAVDFLLGRGEAQKGLLMSPREIFIKRCYENPIIQSHNPDLRQTLICCPG